MARRKHGPGPEESWRRPRRGLTELSEAKSLMRQGKWSEAREILEAVDSRYPNQPAILEALADVCRELGDAGGYQRACERLLRWKPDDPDLLLGLAGTHLTSLRPVLALRTFRRFLERWPDDPRAGEVRPTVAELEASVGDVLREMGLSGDQDLELAAWHEQAQGLTEQGEFRQAGKLLQQVLRRRPDFVPGLNNLSQVEALEGQLDRAIETAGRVLSLDPNNVHALANLTRYLCLGGRLDEARQMAERLKAVESDRVDAWVKKMEALTYLGDDEGVLEVFRGAEQAGALEPDLVGAIPFHLAAVAAMRLGREDEARRLWERALAIVPGLELALANLADLDKPIGERHAPWPFDMAQWVSPKAAVDLVVLVGPAAERGGERAVVQATRRYLRGHPEVVHLVPILLDRGDPGGREFAWRTASSAETPEMLAALRDFALGQRGPDEMRLPAAQSAIRAGLLPDEPTRLWLGGEWRLVQLADFELHDEPLWPHSPRGEALLEEGESALFDDQPAQAERALKEALGLDPGAPDLLYDLAMAYEQQGRTGEAETTLRSVLQRDPDSVLARAGLSRLWAGQGKLDDARAILRPVLSRRRLHYDEYAALVSAQIEQQLAMGDLESARTWLDTWEDADPDHPGIDRYYRRLGEQGGRAGEDHWQIV